MTGKQPTKRPDDAVALNPQRLQALLDGYGAAPHRWPADERDAALVLLARSAEARTLWEDAARLDSLLLQSTPPAPGDDLVRAVKDMPLPGQPRLVQRPRRAGLPRPRLSLASVTRRFAPMAAACAAAFALGMVVPLPLDRGDNRPVAPAAATATPAAAGSALDIAEVAIVDATLADTGTSPAVEIESGFDDSADDQFSVALTDLQLE